MATPVGPGQTGAGSTRHGRIGSGSARPGESGSASAPLGPTRLRLSNRSIVLAVAASGLTVVLVRTTEGSFRVLGWIVAAASVAGLLYPAVRFLARWMPEGVAVLVVALGTLGFLGAVGYALVTGVVNETRQVQEAAPAWARQVEGSSRFGQLARDARLAERVQTTVDAIPRRLQGGSTSDALRSAASRTVAFLATAVLTLFFVLRGPRIAGAALSQVAKGERRARLEAKLGRAARRGFGYARGTLALAVTAGLFGYGVARFAGAPGAAPLGLWMALWDVVPLAGALVGALPIVILGGINEPGWYTAAMVAAFVGYQVVENLFAHRIMERRTVKVGAFLTAGSAFAGLELYGIAGAMVLILVAALVVAAADELAPD